MPTRAKLRAFKVTIAVASMSIAYLAAEFGYRWYMYRTLVDADYPVTIASANAYEGDTPGYYRPHAKFHWRQFDAQHNLVHQCQVAINNRGFISANDYQVAKLAGEFRIALIGDSLTACITNDIPWADLLEKKLDGDAALKQRLGAQTVRVMNFGLPGSGFHRCAINYRGFASAYAPDLVIVNYIEDDFPREGNTNLLLDVPSPETEFPVPKAFFAQVQEAKIQIVGNITPELYRAYADPLQIPGASPAFFFVVEDDTVTFDAEKIASIKRETANRYLSARVWRSSRPHLLYRALGQPFSLSYTDSMFASLSHDVGDQVEHALQGIRDIQSRHPRVILLRNPLIQDLDGRVSLQEATRLLEQRAPDIKIVRMEKYMPIENGRKDIYKWFNLPHDGHFSNYGVAIYAQAVHAMISEHFSTSSGVPLPASATADNGADATVERR